MKKERSFVRYKFTFRCKFTFLEKRVINFDCSFGRVKRFLLSTEEANFDLLDIPYTIKIMLFLEISCFN